MSNVKRPKQPTIEEVLRRNTEQGISDDIEYAKSGIRLGIGTAVLAGGMTFGSGELVYNHHPIAAVLVLGCAAWMGYGSYDSLQSVQEAGIRIGQAQQELRESTE